MQLHIDLSVVPDEIFYGIMQHSIKTYFILHFRTRVLTRVKQTLCKQAELHILPKTFLNIRLLMNPQNIPIKTKIKKNIRKP